MTKNKATEKPETGAGVAPVSAPRKATANRGTRSEAGGISSQVETTPASRGASSKTKQPGRTGSGQRPDPAAAVVPDAASTTKARAPKDPAPASRGTSSKTGDPVAMATKTRPPRRRAAAVEDSTGSGQRPDPAAAVELDAPSTTKTRARNIHPASGGSELEEKQPGRTGSGQRPDPVAAVELDAASTTKARAPKDPAPASLKDHGPDRAYLLANAAALQCRKALAP